MSSSWLWKYVGQVLGWGRALQWLKLCRQKWRPTYVSLVCNQPWPRRSLFSPDASLLIFTRVCANLWQFGLASALLGSSQWWVPITVVLRLKFSFKELCWSLLLPLLMRLYLITWMLTTLYFVDEWFGVIATCTLGIFSGVQVGRDLPSKGPDQWSAKPRHTWTN